MTLDGDCFGEEMNDNINGSLNVGVKWWGLRIIIKVK